VPKSADPAAMPEPEFSAKPRPVPKGRPEDDPPMTVRVRDYAARFDPNADRAFKVGTRQDSHLAHRTYCWVGSSGGICFARLSDEDVRDWTPVHPITWRTAFDHLAADDARAREPEAIAGDMDVTAFRTEK
jgi:hypothetical protein